MSPSIGPYFFISYSRIDSIQQRRIISELRERGINIWLDTDNLVPGSPAWEREIERSIRGAAGVIALLSPESNNSEWVRREVSFAEENDKRIFPVLIHGAENDSVPLRLSSHQRVDLRWNFNKGLNELVHALKDHLGTTVVNRTAIQKPKKTFEFSADILKKLALPAALVFVAILCIGGFIFASRLIGNIEIPTKTATLAIITPTLPIDVNLDITPTNGPVVNHDAPTGKIVYTCQIKGDEICIINADESGWRQLTDSPQPSYYSSLAPDGQFVIFISKDTGATEIYETNLANGKTKQLTKLKKDLGSPEISPDNNFIAFTYRADSNSEVWIMNRNGSDPHVFYSLPGKDAHEPTWSPDGSKILFALGRGDSNKLYIKDFNGHDPKVVNSSIDTRGRSDWSINDLIAFDMGGRFMHNVYTMNLDGSNLRQISNGSNAQGTSFSPDGKWIAFTGYTDVANKDESSCEIFMMWTDGSDIRRVTKNSYCDYQPRWGK